MIHVLQSVAPPATTTKFIDQVVRHAPEDIRFSYFSWARALFGRYDVLHLHWPEYMIRNRTRWKAAVNKVAFQLLLARLKFGRIAVVRTAHNPKPHQPGSPRESAALERLDRLVSNYVVLNESSLSNVSRHVDLIPHGHYIDEFAHIPKKNATRGSVVYFGRIEPYKGVVDLQRRLSREKQLPFSFRIVGSADEETALEITRTAKRHPQHFSAHIAFVSDEDMVAEITGAELIVLPYAEMHNSGVLLVALSLRRPVLVPASPVSDELAREVGEGWIIQSHTDISSEVIADALAAVRTRRTAQPDLSARAWKSVAAAYANVFRKAAGGQSR